MSTPADNQPDDRPPSGAHLNRALRIAALAGLALVTLVAGYMRSRQLGESLWIDELHTAWAADGALAEVAPRAYAGNQSPLYFYLVWALARVLGMSELAVRLPSLAAGILLVPAAYYVVVRWTASRAGGLLAAVIIAVDPHCLYYALDGRPYALVQLAALAHVFVFSQLLLAKPPPVERPLLWLRVAFVLGAAVLFYLHYTAALLLPAEVAAYALVWPWRRRSMAYGPMRLAVDLAIVAGLWLPAGPHLLEVAGRRENWKVFIGQPPFSASLLWFPLIYAAVWPGMLLAMAVGVRWVFRRRPLIGRVAIPLALLACCWETVPAGVAWTTTQADVARLFFLRYLNVSVPAAAAIAGLLAGWTEGRFARLLQLAVIGAGAVVVYAVNFGPLYESSGRFVVHSRENWRGAVGYINRNNERSPQPVLVYSGLIEARQLSPEDEELANYCLFPVTGIYKLRGNELPLIPAGRRLELTHQQIARIRSSGGIWLVVRNPPDQTAPLLKQAIEAVVHAGIPRERIVAAPPRRFGDVTVYRIECPTE